MNRTSDPPPVGPRAGLALAVWTGLAIATVRGGLLFAMERLSHGTTLALVQLRVARTLPVVLVVSLLLGFVLVALLVWARGRPRPRTRRILMPLVCLGGAALLFVYWTGWLGDDPTRRIGTQTTRGLQALRALAGTSLVFAIALPAVTEVWARVVTRGTWLLATGSLLAVGAPAAMYLAFVPTTSKMPVTQVALDLLAEGSWTLVRGREDREPHTAIVSPALEYRLHGADLPALVLPPPTTVAFDLEDLDGAARLDARAGVDQTVLDRYRNAEGGPFAVRFRVRTNGRPAFETRIVLQDPEEYRGTEWAELGDSVLVRPGDRLELETAFLDGAGREVTPEEPLLAGFGNLLLSRTLRVPRTLSSPSRPNIVLVVMDTLRADRLSLYGYSRPTSPRLDQWAERGLVFDNAYSTASWTWPSTASILTGLQPPEHGVLDPTSCHLATGCETLAEALQAAGLTTAAWSANPLIVPDKSFDQGFETFDHGKASTRPTELVMPGALEWLETIGDTRFFLYVHVADPHAPLDPLPQARDRFARDVPADFDPRAIVEYSRELLQGKGHSSTGEVQTDRVASAVERQHVSDLYDACVWSGDWWFGRLLDTLEREGLADRTVVAFTSDHGEELFEHGLATHAQSVHTELTRIPLVLVGPGIPAGVRVAEPVSNRHLAPTLARIGGGALQDPRDALDLVDAARTGLPASDVLFSTTRGWWNGRYRQPIFGLRRGDWVLHFAPEGGPWGGEPAPDGAWRLYDVSLDPGETANRADEEPERARALRRSIIDRVSELEGRRKTPEVEAGEATLDMLRGLGYVGADEE